MMAIAEVKPKQFDHQMLPDFVPHSHEGKTTWREVMPQMLYREPERECYCLAEGR